MNNKIFLLALSLIALWGAPHNAKAKAEEASKTNVNLVTKSKFTDADFTRSFVATPLIFGEWVTYKDAEKEKKPISFAVSDDAERGKVGTYTGKPSSWYTSFVAQRIQHEFKPGIYKLSFWAKSTDGAKLKTFIRLTGADGGDVQRFFIKETGRPTEDSKKYYGSFSSHALTNKWTKYEVDFNSSLICKTMYQFTNADTEKASATDLTNVSICFQGDKDATTIMFDDVQLILVEDFSEPDKPVNPSEGNNILASTDFVNADFTKNFNTDNATGVWMPYNDTAKDPSVKIGLINDSELNKQVLSFTGKPTSWYTSFVGQRINGPVKKGIYRLSFLAKSADAAKLRLMLPCGSNFFFIKETGKPTDNTQKYYGSYIEEQLQPEWKEYVCDFNLAQSVKNFYSYPLTEVQDATATQLNNVMVYIQGCVANKTALVANVQLTLIEDLSEPEQPESQVGKNILASVDFTKVDLSKDFNTDVLYDQWIRHYDETKDPAVAIALVDNKERGKQVLSFTGRPNSWYTSFVGQRVAGTTTKGIYRLSFWAKSDDAAKLRISLPCGNNYFFIKETGKPANDTQTYYGSYVEEQLTAEWKEFTCDFDLSRVMKSFYSYPLKDTEEVTSAQLNNLSVYIQGCVAGKTALVDKVELTLIEDLSEPVKPEDPSKNLLKDAGFDAVTAADLDFKNYSLETGKWHAVRDAENEKNTVTVALEKEAAQGQVLSIEGNSYSWYTTAVTQFIEGKIDKGIYRLSFKGKSENGGGVRLIAVCTNEDGTERLQRFFVKAKGIPTDTQTKWRGTYQQVSLSPVWQEYSVEFNTSLVGTTQYDLYLGKNIEDATDVDLTKMGIHFYNDRKDTKILLDDFKFEKISDIDDKPQVVKYDFEEATLSKEWLGVNSIISQDSTHYTSGANSLNWHINSAQATLEVSLGKPLRVTGNNAASFAIYSTKATEDDIYVDFINTKGDIAKRATINLNFIGWRNFERPYNEYENKGDTDITKVRFTYGIKKGNRPNVKINLDDVDFNADVNPARQYPEMLVKDLPYLTAKNARLLSKYVHGTGIEVAIPTEEELADLTILRENFKRTPVANPGLVRKLLMDINNLSMVRNPDGTVRGKQLVDTKNITKEFLIDLSHKIEAMGAAYIAGSPSMIKTLFPMWIDLIIDQGIFYGFSGFTWSDYATVTAIPTGVLNAMNAFNDNQKAEICKAMGWILESNMAYAPVEVTVPGRSSDYVYNALSNVCASFIFQPDNKLAVEGAKASKMLTEQLSEYTPGGNDILKPDGTGFHHQTHYNAYMYSYRSWINVLSDLKGTCFGVNKETYERIKKAVISELIMATKSATGSSNMFANSLAGRHPLTGGTEISLDKASVEKLIEVGGSIYGTEIDVELASYYNYFFMSDKYSGVPEVNVDGFYQFNYSPIGVYRQNNWVATMRCPTTKFWGAEIYDKTNRFGRYQSHGSLEVVYDGIPENSGRPSAATATNGGWDWNVSPGATTVHYTNWKDMMPNGNVSDRFDQFALTTNFSGALAWGDCGMFGAEFDQGDSWGTRRFMATNLKFKKSVYAFDGLLISLGSDISASGTYADDMITATNLFQSIDSKVSTDPLVNGVAMTNGSAPIVSKGESSLRILSPQQTGYIIAKGNNEVIIKHGEQSAPGKDGSNVNNPVTVAAAKAYINHGVKTANKSYEFVVVPATDDKSLSEIEGKINQGALYKVCAKNENMHVLKYYPKDIVAYTLFKKAEGLNFGKVKSADSEMLLMEKFDSTYNVLYLSVCNPNLKPISDPVYKWREGETKTSLTVQGEMKLDKEIEGVVVTLPGNGTTKIDFTLAKGMPLYLTLIDKDATGLVENKQDNEMKVYTVGNEIIVLNAEGEVSVYSLTGQVVKNITANGKARFSVETPGCYILRNNEKVVKVLVR